MNTVRRSYSPIIENGYKGRPSAGGSHMGGVWGRDKMPEAPTCVSENGYKIKQIKQNCLKLQK